MTFIAGILVKQHFLITASTKELAKGVNCLQTCALTVVESVFLHCEGDPSCILSPAQYDVMYLASFSHLAGVCLYTVTVHLLSLAVITQVSCSVRQVTEIICLVPHT